MSAYTVVDLISLLKLAKENIATLVALGLPPEGNYLVDHKDIQVLEGGEGFDVICEVEGSGEQKIVWGCRILVVDNIPAYFRGSRVLLDDPEDLDY